MAWTIEPLTPGRWDDFAELFGPSGACYGCWCTYFRLKPKEREAIPKEDRKALMQARVKAGPAPGLLAYSGEAPVGWMQIGPRADVPEWNNAGRVSAPLEDAPVSDSGAWAISCFFFKSSERGKGLSHAMVRAGIDFSRKNRARVLEVCPMDQAKQAKSVGLFVGSTRVFQKAGFREVALRKAGRPLMRLDLA